MKQSDLKALFSEIWANSPDADTVREIPSKDPGNGGASFEKGYSKVNMTPRAAGGIPPYGQDMNGILQTLSKASQRREAGTVPPWSEDFAKAIGGYPKTAQVVIINNGQPDILVSLADNNLDDPNGESANWASIRNGLALSKDYLPLSGGKLTGNLSGTTAKFSGVVDVGIPSDVPGKTGTAAATTKWIDENYDPSSKTVSSQSGDTLTRCDLIGFSKNNKNKFYAHCADDTSLSRTLANDSDVVKNETVTSNTDRQTVNGEFGSGNLFVDPRIAKNGRAYINQPQDGSRVELARKTLVSMRGNAFTESLWEAVPAFFDSGATGFSPQGTWVTFSKPFNYPPRVAISQSAGNNAGGGYITDITNSGFRGVCDKVTASFTWIAMGN